MSYITEIFDRMNIQQIRKFLLHGAECIEIDNCSYKSRIDNATSQLFDNLQKTFPQITDCEQLNNIVCTCLSEYQNVYMEIGLQAGATLATQLILNHD